MKRRIEQSESAMLWLAGLAVVLYLAELRGVWTLLGVETAYWWLSTGIDVIFVCDLVLKLWALGATYRRGPWILVDVISSAPILAEILVAPQLQGLRMFRFFRLFRTLRVLRVLRSLRVLNLLKVTPDAQKRRSIHDERFDKALRFYVVLFVILFLTIIGIDRSTSPPELVAEAEFYLVLGTVLGMLLVLGVVRYQIPAMSARQVRALLNVALPHQVADHFMDNPEAYENTVRMPATIVFCDIEGFTSTVEELGGNLDKLKAHLEEAMDAIVEAHLARDLIVDKFIGDAVMSFRGGDLSNDTPADNAWRVVRAALDGAIALEQQDNPFFSRIKIGGASGEDCLIGAFGTSRRLSYTVLGDRVNLAARLEGSCSALGVRTLFCSQTYELTKDRDDIVWRRVGVLSVQGKDQTIAVYEAFDPAVDSAFVEPFHRALSAWEGRDFEGALKGFEQVSSIRTSGDGPSAQYAQRCRDLLLNGVPEDWSPVVQTKK
jgi:adenylate cyclase